MKSDPTQGLRQVQQARMVFRPSGRRTMRGPIYVSDAGYEVVQESNRKWYFRDHEGFIGGENFWTKREAIEAATEWFQQYGGGLPPLDPWRCPTCNREWP